MTPDIFDQLDALWRRFDMHPEARFLESGGAELKRGAYLAFLDARQLIDKLRAELHTEVKGWQPIATFFSAEPETPMVLLWCGEDGEGSIHLGYWDDDERAWYREGQGPDLESEPLQPTKWMALGELMRVAEFIAVPRMD